MSSIMAPPSRRNSRACTVNNPKSATRSPRVRVNSTSTRHHPSLVVQHSTRARYRENHPYAGEQTLLCSWLSVEVLIRPPVFRTLRGVFPSSLSKTYSNFFPLIDNPAWSPRHGHQGDTAAGRLEIVRS